jgi:hypothetical protein
MPRRIRSAGNRHLVIAGLGRWRYQLSLDLVSGVA